MADRILTLRELNRATLARQMLLERATVSVPAAIERLAGLQAQLSSAPFIGLWTRLRDLRREDLARLIENRTVVKATLMRATLHLFTAEDYVRFRATLQSMLSSAGGAIAKQRGAEIDLDRLLAAARRYIGDKPRTFNEISDMVAELMPDQDVGAMRYSVRTQIPLVQTPIAGGWSYYETSSFLFVVRPNPGSGLAGVSRTHRAGHFRRTRTPVDVERVEERTVESGDPGKGMVVACDSRRQDLAHHRYRRWKIVASDLR